MNRDTEINTEMKVEKKSIICPRFAIARGAKQSGLWEVKGQTALSSEDDMGQLTSCWKMAGE